MEWLKKKVTRKEFLKIGFATILGAIVGLTLNKFKIKDNNSYGNNTYGGK